MRNISDKICTEIKHIQYSNAFSPKSCPLEDNVEKYSGVREATDNKIIWYIRFA
jgi:hypothetical protein